MYVSNYRTTIRLYQCEHHRLKEKTYRVQIPTEAYKLAYSTVVSLKMYLVILCNPKKITNYSPICISGKQSNILVSFKIVINVLRKLFKKKLYIYAYNCNITNNFNQQNNLTKSFQSNVLL